MFNHSKFLKSGFVFGFLLTSASLLEPAHAQTQSHDGHRWYEIELSIFSNQELELSDPEIEIPERTHLSYPDDIKQLMPATSSYQYDFEDETSLDAENLLLKDQLSQQQPDFNNPQWTLPPPQAINLGPEYSPAKNNFRVLDFSSDAFIALGAKHQQFTKVNERIANSDEHRLLYHSVWRQPVLNRVQSSAIFISGGEQYGSHNELEGSIRISFNVNRIDVDADLWLSRFSSNIDEIESSWKVPPPPFAITKLETLTSIINSMQIEENLLVLSSIAHLKEVRSMRSATLHYMDHPAFGLLIEIRPYQLPDNFAAATELDGSFE